jgi:hypothetical protein
MLHCYSGQEPQVHVCSLLCVLCCVQEPQEQRTTIFVGLLSACTPGDVAANYTNGQLDCMQRPTRGMAYIHLILLPARLIWMCHRQHVLAAVIQCTRHMRNNAHKFVELCTAFAHACSTAPSFCRVCWRQQHLAPATRCTRSAMAAGREKFPQRLLRQQGYWFQMMSKQHHLVSKFKTASYVVLVHRAEYWCNLHSVSVHMCQLCTDASAYIHAHACDRVLGEVRNMPW